ncbi:hypothetical protein LJK87_43900 [Paenibacillus sp. P25]|nr:hypothetical protein LJK87_43900 [Paenibacillus sp. P25]
MKPVVFISKLILMVSAASLLLVGVLSWLTSLKIYTPIDRLVHLLGADRFFSKSPADYHDEFNFIERQWLHLTRESLALQNKLEHQLPHVKEGFLLQLVQGFLYSHSEEELLERMRSFGWEVDGRQFLVLHVQLTGFENLEGRFSPGDEGLVTFAAANIISELAASRFEQANMINFHDLSVGLFIIHPADQSYQAELKALCSELMQAISHLLKLRVSVTIGKPSTSIVQLHTHYEEVREALIYRNFVSENQIIDLESLEEGETSEFAVPVCAGTGNYPDDPHRPSAGSAELYCRFPGCAAGTGSEGNRRPAMHAPIARQHSSFDPASGHGSESRVQIQKFVRAIGANPGTAANAELV